jgi:hypothetical protein
MVQASDPTILAISKQPPVKTISDKELNFSYLTTYQRINLTRVQWDLEFTRFIPQSRELAQHFDPTRYYEYFDFFDLPKQEEVQVKILNGTPLDSVNAMVAGMSAGCAPAAQEWFDYTLNKPSIEKMFEVQQWLHDEKAASEQTIQQSNFYPNFAIFLRDFIIQPGACMLIERDPVDVFRTTIFRFGQYRIALDAKGYPTGFGRTFRKTVRQVIEEFGRRVPVGNGETQLDISNFSQRIISYAQAGLWDKFIDIYHYVGPNSEHDTTMLASKYNQWKSVYHELGVPPETDALYPERFLREEGYDYFPVIFGAWETNGKDAYATNNPAIQALADTKELYFLEQQLMLAIDLDNNPPVAKHPDIQEVDMLPGGDTTVSEAAANTTWGGIKSLRDVQHDKQSVKDRIHEKEEAVKQHFMADFFRRLVDNENKQPITATEVVEIKKEIMVLLGPAFGQITKFVLTPFIQIVFHLRKKAGLVQPAPLVMDKMKIEPKFISTIAKALKMGDFSLLQSGVGFLSDLSKQIPNAVHLMEEYEVAKGAFDILGIDPKMLKTKEDYNAALQAVAKQQQAETAAKAAPAMAGAAQTLSQTPAPGGDPGTTMLEQLSQMNQAGTGFRA